MIYSRLSVTAGRILLCRVLGSLEQEAKNPPKTLIKQMCAGGVAPQENAAAAESEDGEYLRYLLQFCSA